MKPLANIHGMSPSGRFVAGVGYTNAPSSAALGKFPRYRGLFSKHPRCTTFARTIRRCGREEDEDKETKKRSFIEGSKKMPSTKITSSHRPSARTPRNGDGRTTRTNSSECSLSGRLCAGIASALWNKCKEPCSWRLRLSAVDSVFRFERQFRLCIGANPTTGQCPNPRQFRTMVLVFKGKRKVA